MPSHETDEWKIGAFLEYVPKKLMKTVECRNCGGRGRTNMHFGSLDEPEHCWECNGSGSREVMNHPRTPAPKLPQKMIDFMQKCYLEYKLK